MDCPYIKNSFFSNLTPELRNKLCGACNRITYPAGNVLSTQTWNDTFTVLVDGFIISASSRGSDDGSFIPLELIGCGHFLTVPQQWAHVRRDNVSSFVILKSTVAIFDRACIEDLYDSDIDFVKAICKGYDVGYHEMAAAFQEIGCSSAQSAVKYVLQFCRTHGIPQLTHAQIALAAGLTRPTVTKTIHELIKTEPELFQPRNLK